jgi:hypothetical protein
MAATKTKNLVIKFIADTKNLDQGMKKTMGKFKAMETSAKSFGPHASGTFKRIGDFAGQSASGGLGRFASMVKAMPAWLKALAVVGIGVTASLKSIIRAGIEAEDTLVKMGVILGSSTKAAQKYKEAIDFSLITPFVPADVLKAQEKGLENNIDVFQKGIFGIKGNIATLAADMAAFAGQGMTMQQTATAIFRGQLELLEKFPIQARVAHREAVKVAKLGTPEFIQAFIKNLDKVKIWQGSAERLSDTMSGMWSSIVGFLGRIPSLISGAEIKGQVTLWSELKAIVRDIRDGLGEFVAFIRPLLIDIGAVIGLVFRSVWEFIKATIAVLKPVLMPAFKLIFIIARSIFWIIKQVGRFVVWILQQIAIGSEIVFGWIDALLGITQQIQAAMDFFRDLWAFLTILFQLFTGFVGGKIDKLKEIFGAIPAAIAKAWKAVTGAIDLAINKAIQFYNQILRILGLQKNVNAATVIPGQEKTFTEIDPETGKPKKFVDPLKEFIKPLELKPKDLGEPITFTPQKGKGAFETTFEPAASATPTTVINNNITNNVSIDQMSAGKEQLKSLDFSGSLGVN